MLERWEKWVNKVVHSLVPPGFGAAAAWLPAIPAAPPLVSWIPKDGSTLTIIKGINRCKSYKNTFILNRRDFIIFATWDWVDETYMLIILTAIFTRTQLNEWEKSQKSLYSICYCQDFFIITQINYWRVSERSIYSTCHFFCS